MNRNFFLLWQGQFVSRIESQGFTIAMMFWVKHETGSATLMGTLAMVSSLSALLLSPVGGTFADRYSRRKIIIFSDALRGVAVLSLAGLMFIVPHSTEVIYIWIIFVSLLSSAIGSFFNPAISASIPDLVPEDKVAGANSLNTSSAQLARFIGQAVGGVLFRLLGAPLLFLVDGLTYLFSAGSESFVKIPQVIPETNHRWKDVLREFKKDTVEGIHYIWAHGGMRAFIFVNIILGFFLPPILLLLPFYVEDILHVKTDWYGFLMATWGLGAMLGSLSAGFIKVSGRVKSRLIIVFLVLFSISLGLLGLIRTPFIALIIMAVIGILLGYVGVSLVSILQLSVPSELRGRVLGVLDTLAGAAYPLAMGLAGIVADMTDQNIPLIYVTSHFPHVWFCKILNYYCFRWHIQKFLWGMSSSVRIVLCVFVR